MFDQNKLSGVALSDRNLKRKSDQRLNDISGDQNCSNGMPQRRATDEFQVAQSQSNFAQLDKTMSEGMRSQVKKD